MYDQHPQTLKQRRAVAEKAWHNFLRDTREQQPIALRQEINDSWCRSQQYLPSPETVKANLSDAYETNFHWHESGIRKYASRELGQLMELVNENRCVAGIADVTGKLLWTYASPHMETIAADQNFIAGGKWSEQNSGTNAVGLSLKTRAPVTVFSAEHYNPSLHEWDCYSSPIIHPQTQELIGSIDLSTTWEQHNPMGQVAVSGLAQSIAMKLHQSQNTVENQREKAELEIRLLGNPAVYYQGKQIRLSLRHIEILCLLILHPEGMTLDALHVSLYGDSPVTKNTLKSEISTLRNILSGKINSRPYRLDLSVQADFIELWTALKNQQLERSLQLYRGSLLAESNSPEIEQWRYCIEAVISKMINGCNDLSSILQQTRPGADNIIRERLLELSQL